MKFDGLYIGKDCFYYLPAKNPLAPSGLLVSR
jgi:hypothetical protein